MAEWLVLALIAGVIFGAQTVLIKVILNNIFFFKSLNLTNNPGYIC